MSDLERGAAPAAANIRRTEDGQSSVFDLLEVSGAVNPRAMWSQLIKTYPEVTKLTSKLKFPGSGQRFTPVTNEAGWRQIKLLLPGNIGKQFRRNEVRYV